MKKIILITESIHNYIKGMSLYYSLKDYFKLKIIYIGEKFDEKTNNIIYKQLKYNNPDFHISIEKNTKAGKYDNKLYMNNINFLKNKDKAIQELINYEGEFGQLGEIRNKLNIIFNNMKQDLVIILGDNIGALAAALAAKKNKIDIANINSGLYYGDLQINEEVNRILIDSITKYHFTTLQSSINNLKNIGIIDNVYLVGNIIVDAQKNYLQKSLDTKYNEILNLNKNKYVLIEVNYTNDLYNIQKLEEISKIYTVVFYINSQIKNNSEIFEYINKCKEKQNIIFLDKVSYFEFICLIANCRYLITENIYYHEVATSLNILYYNTCDLFNNININEINDIKLKKSNQNIPLWDGKSSNRILKIIKIIYNKLNIAVNVGGYHEIGTGHIFRQISMMDEKPYFNYIFLISSIHTLAKKVLEENFIDYIIYNDYNDLINIIKNNNIDIIINDILDTDTTLMKELKNNGLFILNYEDRSDAITYADIVINDMYPINNFKNLNNVYTGSEYTCMRRDLTLYQSSIKRDKVNKIILTFGGSDPCNYTELCLKILTENNIHTKIKIIIILGLGYLHDNKIYNNYKHPNIYIYKNIQNMARILRNGDIAITSNGRTLLELCYFQVPTISLAQNEREKTHVHAKEENGIIFLGMKNEFTNNSLLKNINNLINNMDYRFLLRSRMFNSKQILLNSNKKIWDLLINKYIFK